MEASSRFSFLLQRLRNNLATPEEMKEFANLLDDPAIDPELRRIWESISPNAHLFDETSSEKLFAAIRNNKPRETPQPAIRRRPRILLPAMAASLLLAAFLFWINRSSPPPVNTSIVEAAPASKTVIKPGGNKAVLILDDGSSITLDSNQQGSIAIQGSTKVSNRNGRISYDQGDKNGQSTAISYNTLKTPKGGQYQLELSDGTKLWMNAASSLRYPIAFSENERTVELQGEAYFEVAKDAKRPFRVMVDGMQVEVLGTHFNIMAYKDEKKTKTTLLEGAVRVSDGRSIQRLLPGQQAQSSTESDIQVLDGVDLEEVVAWKNGYFQFNRSGLDVLMRQIERWYDVDVKYEGKIAERQFGGKISRASNIADVLKILELSKVSFRIQGKQIIVTNKN